METFNEELKPIFNKNEYDDRHKKLKNSKGEIFYYKRESNWFFELVCEKIAELLGIKAVCHIFYKYNSMPGLISMDFHKKGYNYIDGEELIKNYFSKHPDAYIPYFEIDDANNLQVLWWAIEDRYRHYPNKSEIVEKLMRQFMELYEFSIITAQGDLHLSNYQIEESKTDASLAPLYDNSQSFLNYPISVLSVDEMDSRVSSYDSLRRYFEFVPIEVVQSFFEKVSILDLATLSSIMDNIIKEVPVSEKEKEELDFEKKEALKIFLRHKSKLLKICNEYLNKENHIGGNYGTIK